MTDSHSSPLRLRHLGVGARLGLTFLVLTLLGGLAASAQHLLWHHQNRDELPGLSMDDLKGAYHGVNVRSPLIVALERAHPDGMPQADRDALLKWLRGTRISEDYDNLDLGAGAPAEIIAARCVSCHSRQSTDSVAKRLPLEFFDDVKAVAFSRDIRPTDIKILAASTHTHAISLGVLSIVVSLLLYATRWARSLVGAAIALMGLALFADIAAWWLARESAGLVYIIVIAGAIYNALTALTLLAVLADLWLPTRRGSA
jgi:hypothetical protein